MYVDVRSHHFAVTNMSREAMYEMNSFLKGLKQWGFIRLPNGKCIREVIRVFAAYTNDKREFRIPISLLPKFETHFQNSLASDYVINRTPAYSPIPTVLKMKSHWVPREAQVPVIEYLTAPGHPISKFVDLQPGAGKSLRWCARHTGAVPKRAYRRACPCACVQRPNECGPRREIRPVHPQWSTCHCR